MVRSKPRVPVAVRPLFRILLALASATPAIGLQEDPLLERHLRNTYLESEIARLDNDPSFPEHGVIEIEVRGGR